MLDPTAPPADRRAAKFRVLVDWTWSLLGVLPYLAIPLIVAIRCPAGESPTGFLQDDQPYYLANGRAVFERGNGLAGPNPYDPDPSAPAIYFHTLVWLWGFGIHVLGVAPGALYVGVGIAAALVLSRLTLALVDQFGARPARRVPLFLLAMWGGGIACALALALNGVQRRSPVDGLLRFEPLAGWWMLYWGQNALYATEAVYHVLMAGAWLAAGRRRWGICLAIVAVLAASHPFSGVQALAIFLAWSVLGQVKLRDERVPPWFLAALGTIFAAFAVYYFVFLSSYPAHRNLQAVWGLAWVETPAQTFACYALVAPAAVVRFWRERRKLTLDTLFLGVAAGVSFGLSHHDWLVSPKQPLHFTHGYVWMPLYLLGLPVYARAFDWAIGRAGRLLLVATVAAVACFDNVAWLVSIPRNWVGDRSAEAKDDRPDRKATMLPDHLRTLFREIDRQGRNGVLLCDDPMTSYLAATYTRVRPYYGHWFNTPDYDDRKREAEAWFAGGAPVRWRVPIDYVLAQAPLPDGADREWTAVSHAGPWTLYARRTTTRD